MPPESEVRQLIAKDSFSLANMAYRLDREAGFFEYRMTIRTQSGKALEKLADTLRARGDILEFRISPSGD